jgi:uncharacterized surface protein with fasciclin (FAS1) repeats
MIELRKADMRTEFIYSSLKRKPRSGFKPSILFHWILFILVLIFSACKEKEAPESFYSEDELLITAYLTEHSDVYSTLLEVLEITGTSSVLNAYGHYTFFAPDNDAFNEFCKNNNKNSVSEFSKDYLTTLVKYHLLNKDIETNFLPNGVLPDTNFTGDNLVFNFSEGGVNSITVNGEAVIIQRDIKVSNGHINHLDKVLTPVFFSVYDKIAADPAFSIFAEALELTGLKDTLSIIYVEQPSMKYLKNRFTIFAESNQVFESAGINSLEELRARFSTSGDPKNHLDGLYKFMSYHCMAGLYYLNQLDSFNYPTLAENELINVAIDEDVYLNRHTKNDTVYSIGVDRGQSNSSAKNGVIHAIDQVMEEYVPIPVYLVFDFTSYQAISIGNQYTVSELKDIKGIDAENTGVWYRMSMLPEDSSYLETTSSKVGWNVEFQIPPIVKGKYRVVFHWVSTHDRSTAVQAFWDGEILGQEFSMIRSKRPPMVPPEWLYDFHFDEEIGRVNLNQTSPHTIRFVGLADGYGDFDYIAFWPV